MKKVYSILAFLMLVIGVQSQNITTLTFTGRDVNDMSVQLNSVVVTNHTQHWQEVLHYPDTVLYLGTSDIQSNELADHISLYQNHPNPFDGTTEFYLQLNDKEHVVLEIFDLAGKSIARYSEMLMPGTHAFKAELASPSTYLLSAKMVGDVAVIKMVNQGYGGDNAIEYLGLLNDVRNTLKKGSIKPYHSADVMEYVGTASINGTATKSEVINAPLEGSQTYTLMFPRVLPIVSTDSVSLISHYTAVGHATVLKDGGSTVTQRGICWGRQPNPTIENGGHIGVGDGLGHYDGMMADLQSNTTYYARAYATNGVGTAYGPQIEFKTAVYETGKPCVSEPTVTDYDNHVYNTVQIGNQCWMREDLRTTHYADGTLISKENDPSVQYYSHDVNDYVLYSWSAVMYGYASTNESPSRVQGVCPDGWHVPSKAEFDELKTYCGQHYALGGDTNNIAKALASTKGWIASTNIYTVGNNLGANNISGFSAAPVGYYDDSFRGVGKYANYWSATSNAIDTALVFNVFKEREEVSFNSSSSNLGYSVRCLRDTISGGWEPKLPVVKTSYVSQIKFNSAVCGGAVTDDGGAPITACGICWSTSPNPTVDSGHTTDSCDSISFESFVAWLTANTIYYVRAYAINVAGIAYGAERQFTTLKPFDCGTVLKDVEGNTYNTVQIGSQCWMQSNLRSTKYADGTPILQGKDTSSTTAYWYYDSNNNYPEWQAELGLLYNWPAVMRTAESSNSNPSQVQGVCPVGWHVPSKTEFEELKTYCGHQYAVGGNVENIGQALASRGLWIEALGAYDIGYSPSIYNNTSGFNAVPVGEWHGYFSGQYSEAQFWSATTSELGKACHLYFYSESAKVVWGETIKYYLGFSVRCLSDEEVIDGVTRPTVITGDVSNVERNSAVCGGVVTDEGGAPIIERGVCWSSSHMDPTIGDEHVIDSSELNVFTSNLSLLAAGTTYYIRAYATNTVFTAYGNTRAFTTQMPVMPKVTTDSVSNILATTATCGGNVISDGGAPVTVRGICWNTSPHPTINNDYAIEGYGTGTFSCFMIGLSEGETYYVRAYATNIVGTTYGEEYSFTTDYPNCGTVTDNDNNTYHTVVIGNQCWMKENLRTTRYADGTVISQGSNTSTTLGYWYYPNNDSSNKVAYGLLYNWKAVMRNSSSSDMNPSRVQGICPMGWHVPSDDEWTQLTDYVSTQSKYLCDDYNRYIAKSLASNLLWNSYSGICAVGNQLCTNNATGFSGVPAGNYSGSYDLFGYHAYFWSATEDNDYQVFIRNLNYSSAQLYNYYSNKKYGYSVRCLRDKLLMPTVRTKTVSLISATTAVSGGYVAENDGEPVIEYGICWNTTGNPTISDSHTTDGDSLDAYTSTLIGLSPDTKYYVRAYATVSAGTVYGEQIIFSTTAFTCGSEISDIEGNIYGSVQIGNNCWLRENLRTSKYADGTSITQGNSTSSTKGYWYYPNNDSTNKSIYGLLYNWKAVMHDFPSSNTNPSGVQGICPNGWHVPSRSEYEELITYCGEHYALGGKSENIGKSLADTMGWNSSPNLYAIGQDLITNNASGFSALPAGSYSDTGLFGKEAFFLSSTGSNVACVLELNHSSSSVGLRDLHIYYGQSVRCLSDEEVKQPIISTSAISNTTVDGIICGGNVVSEGGASVTSRGVCWSTSPNPTTDNSKTTDGIGKGAFISTISGLRAGTTYYFRAYATNNVGTAYGEQKSYKTFACGDKILDIDSNSYNTVQIGQQCWMKENIRTTKYADGNSITQGNSTSALIGYWYYPNNNPANKKNYGLLYNWRAVVRDSSGNSTNPSNVQGICPNGWHVPSKTEYNALKTFCEQNYAMGGHSSFIGKALASYVGAWCSSITQYTVGDERYSNNASGFSAMPAGCYYYGQYFDISEAARFWSATPYQVIFLEYDSEFVGWSDYNSTIGFSVRCLLNN